MHAAAARMTTATTREDIATRILRSTRSAGITRARGAPGPSLPRSSLERAGEQAADEVAAERDVDDDGRQRGEQGSGHLDLVLRQEASGQALQRDRDRLLVGIARDGHGEEELVPDARELPDEDDHEGRDREREDHVAVDAEDARAVDARGLDELGE